MVRKWMLALILICLPILATVITAFRVRDIPKIPQDSVKKPKCEDCDVAYKHSVKESDRYQDLKRNAREKEELINQKTSEIKSVHKYNDESDERKKDDLIYDAKTEIDEEHLSIGKVLSDGIKKLLSFVDDDDEDDDDDDEDDDDDDDDDEDDDDNGDSTELNIKNRRIKMNNKLKRDIKSAQNKRSVSIRKSKERNSDEVNEDDEDNISHLQKTKILDSKKSQINIKDLNVKSTFPNYIIKKYLNKDDDLFSEDDENNSEKDIKSSSTKNIVQDTKKTMPKVKLDSSLGTIVKNKLLEDSDNIDDNDGSNNNEDVENNDSYSKLKHHSEFLIKTQTMTKTNEKLKSTPEKIKIELKYLRNKNSDNKNGAYDDDDTTVEDDEDDSKNTRYDTVSKQKTTDSSKKDTVQIKELPENTLAKGDEKVKLDKKQETTRLIFPDKKDTKSKGVVKVDDPKSEKTVKKDKATSEKENKVLTDDAKKGKIESKVIKDGISKENSKKKSEEKMKISGEKNDKPTSSEEFKKIEKKFTYEPKNIDDLRDGFKPYKKEPKAELEKKHCYKKVDKTTKEKPFDNQDTFSTTESHLKHVTDAFARRNLLKSEFEDFYAFFPTFAPNFSRIHNPECRRHGQIVLRQLRGTKLWALNMLDATAKIPSGILQGNGIQLGDFDQCLGSQARVQLESGNVVKVQGQYCLVRLDLKAEHPELETPVHLAQAKNLVRSRIDDPGHFVPRFSTLNWGVCVPAACNPEDVEVIFKDAIKHYQHTSGVALRVKVNEQDCHVEKGTEWWQDWLELPTILTLSFYGVIILLVLVATIQDFFNRRTESQSEEASEKAECDQKGTKDVEKETCGNFLSAFSLYHTFGKLVAPGDTDEISCIHGIRGIATIALLIAHKFLPIAATPYTNRLRITEVVSSPIWSWCRAGWVFTDCFLLLSGALTAHRIATDNSTAAPRRLLSRYIRLTPALLAVVLFYAYIWDNLSSGPMWGTFVTKNTEVCKEGWWWNLLYVQNYFGLEDMCAPQTHQLALDMQLTILGGIIVWVTEVKAGLGKFLLPAMHFAAIYSRYTTVRDHRLTMLAYHGVSVSQLYRTARLSYTSILHRSTPYLVGLSLGVALRNTADHSKILLALGWLSSGALWFLVWWAGIDSGSIQYRYSSTFAAQYAALAPIASALAIAWVIYAVHSGNSNLLSRFLCCRPLVLVSRLSYALYLCQFIVFITNVATVKTSTEFTVLSLIDVQEILAIFLVSTLLTVTLVTPMQSVQKILLPSTKSDKAKRKLQEKETEGNRKQENHAKEKNDTKEVPQIKRHLIAHREALEEIPEAEVEYESQRDSNHLGEILEEEEEEEEEEGEEPQMQIDDDLEIIEEEQGEEDEGEEWIEREEYIPRRSYSNEDEQDLDEWEWTANGSRNGAQHYRYSR